MTDLMPGSAEVIPDLPPPPPAPDATPAPERTPDEKPRRPTTRAGRAAQAAAKKAGSSSKPDAKPKSAKAPRRASLETRLAGSLSTLGMTVVAAGAVTSPAVQADGIAIITHAPSIAAALDKVAKDDPRVAQALERMLTAGVWSGLVAAMLPLVVTIAANHKVIPEYLVNMLNAQAGEPPVEPEAGGIV